MSRPLGWMAAAITLATAEGVNAADDTICNHWRFEPVWLDR